MPDPCTRVANAQPLSSRRLSRRVLSLPERQTAPWNGSSVLRTAIAEFGRGRRNNGSPPALSAASGVHPVSRRLRLSSLTRSTQHPVLLEGDLQYLTWPCRAFPVRLRHRLCGSGRSPCIGYGEMKTTGLSAEVGVPNCASRLGSLETATPVPIFVPPRLTGWWGRAGNLVRVRRWALPQACSCAQPGGAGPDVDGVRGAVPAICENRRAPPVDGPFLLVN